MSIDDEANDFLMGGGGPKSAFNKYDRPGTVKGGTILEARTTQQRDMKDNEPKFWKDGNPMKQLEITVQTDERNPEFEDDDGKRRLFVKSNMTKAVRAAVQAAGAKNLAIGGKLFVQYTGDGEIPGPGLSAPKLYAAHYTPPPVGFGSDEGDATATAGLVMSAPPVATSVATPVATQQTVTVSSFLPENQAAAVADAQAAGFNVTPLRAGDPMAAALDAVTRGGLLPAAGAPAAPGAPAAGGPHAEEQAAVLAMAAAGASLPAATPPAAVPVPSTPPAPAAGVPADLAAALAALTPEQRAAMGIPS